MVVIDTLEISQIGGGRGLVILIEHVVSLENRLELYGWVLAALAVVCLVLLVRQMRLEPPVA